MLHEGIDIAVHLVRSADEWRRRQQCAKHGHKWDWSHGMGEPGVGVARCLRCPAWHSPRGTARGAQGPPKGLRAPNLGAGPHIALETAQKGARAALGAIRVVAQPWVRQARGHSGCGWGEDE